MENVTLDADELGIWLIDETPDGPQQMGHISWKEITRGVEQALLQEKFLLALAKLDEEEIETWIYVSSGFKFLQRKESDEHRTRHRRNSYSRKDYI